MRSKKSFASFSLGGNMKASKAIMATAVAIFGASYSWADTLPETTEQCSEMTDGIIVTGKHDRQDYIENGNNHYLVCYKQVYSENCSVTEELEYCGAEIPFNISYSLTTDPMASDPTKIIISEDEFAANPLQVGGGINVTNHGVPIINVEYLRALLSPGAYYLVINVNSSTKIIKIAIAGESSSGISYLTKTDKEDYIVNANNHIQLRYTQNRGDSTVVFVGTEIPYNITYTLTTDQHASDPTKTIISSDEFATTPVQFNGGIDVSKQGSPVVNTEKLSNELPAGTYYLVTKINTESKAITLAIRPPSNSAELDETMSITGNTVSAKTGFSVAAVKPLEFAISANMQQGAAKQYAVTDMKGQVISSGSLSNGNTHVKVPASGSYIVKVGHESKRINMR